MIEAYVGLPGSGKSYSAVRKLLAERKKGRNVYANFHSKYGDWNFCLWDDMRELYNAFVMIDEAHVWFGSRAWKDNMIEDLAYWQQHRKDGIDMVYVTQHETRVDVVLRELTVFITRFQKIGRFIIRRKYNAADPSPTKKPMKYSAEIFKPWICQKYFSNETIGTRDGKGYKLGRSRLLEFEPEFVRIENRATNQVIVGKPGDGRIYRALMAADRNTSVRYFSKHQGTVIEHDADMMRFWIDNDRSSTFAEMLRMLRAG